MLIPFQGFTVNVEDGAGALSQFRNEDYAAAGANIVGKNEAFSKVRDLDLREGGMCTI